MNGVTTHQDQSTTLMNSAPRPAGLEQEIKEATSLVKLMTSVRKDLVTSSGEAAAEKVYPARKLEVERMKLQVLLNMRDTLADAEARGAHPFTSEKGWTHIGNEPNALLGQLPIGRRGDS